MSTDKQPDDLPPQADISDAERDALLQETLSSLQDAFSAPSDEDDAGTTAEVIQNAAEAVPATDEPELPL